MVDASPWTSVGARRIVAPKAWAIDCMPRQTPSSGMRRSTPTRTASIETPAESGVAGAGRDDDAAQVGRRIGGQGLDAGPVDGVVAQDADLGAGRFEGLDEVERERVVVVDHEDHRDASYRLRRRGAGRRWLGGGVGAGARLGLEAASPRDVVVPLPDAAVAPSAASAMAISRARRTAPALCSVSSNSRSGTEPATMPAPTVRWIAVLAHDGGADRDGGVEVAVVAEVAHGAAVQPAPLPLGLRR